MHRLVAAVAAVLLTALGLTACGGGSSNATDPADLPTKVIDVTADEPGEIHVHSSPEQEFEYDKGSSTIAVKPITTPGIVTVESHTLDKVLFQLQVK